MVRKALCFLPLLVVAALAAQQNSPVKVATAPASADVAPLAPEVADAEATIVKSDWKSAAAQLDVYLATHPNDARALFDAGYVADAQNRLDDAASLYRRATQSDPRSFEARLSLGLLLARQGKLEDARPELVAAVALDPGAGGPALKARAWRALAELDKPSPGHPGDPARASDSLLQALKLTPETPADTLLAAELAEASGQPDTAEAAYRRYLARDPNSAEANAGLAHLLIAQKKYPEAETQLHTALTHAPGNPALTAQLASVLAAQDKPEAIPLLQQLHAAQPQNDDVTRMLADLLVQAGDAAGSDQLVVDLLKTHPDDADLLVTHAQNLTRQLRYAAAAAAFDRATRIDPANTDAWSGLAFATFKTGQPTITLHALTERSKLAPENPSTLFLWATTYDTLHDKVQAAAYYHQFLQAAAGKLPDQEWQARQRLLLLEPPKKK